MERCNLVEFSENRKVSKKVFFVFILEDQSVEKSEYSFLGEEAAIFLALSKEQEYNFIFSSEC